ncbi:GNAT family N-acetyltransferase [Chitinilyticum litopenaei]|uniref:GNAT family N-acetyltransferase n=1 Tax=Chitinilyticum litopenaei TaxID=1121276 RepID=UPI00040C1249|nr:GNAT family N-acetyltransferase [Chitinilyticum litopenaei]
MPIDYLPALATDFEALHQLRLAAMRDSLMRLGRYDEVRSRQRFAASFAPEATVRLFRAGSLLGFYQLRCAAPDWQLDHLYLHPDAQGQGLGSLLLRQLCARADQAGCAITLGALRDSAAKRFYQRHGFTLQHSDELDLYYRREPHTA